MNVWQNTTLSDSDVAQQLIEFLIVSDCELEMTGNDTGFLVVTGSVSSKLEDFSSQILEDSSQIDRCTRTNTLSVVALPQQTMDTADREGKTSFRGAAVVYCQLRFH